MNYLLDLDTVSALSGVLKMLQAFKANLKDNQWLDDQPTCRFEKQDYQFNEKTLAALKEIQTGGGKVFENVEELFKDLDEACRVD
ncbi:hypothetical protein PN36_18785 [Candidatus Thiomargarita nelsonii]|uniref:Uncharacterized protein n=1 Tax=Candidatus Thiomargarita nelsonii TaxID=1003181 RepID=A0A0A6PBM6_9GAMM|nr:hypothetical protein PN36_18785 [Candidatus Thiomargarita nelsonii]